uniref:Putative ribonuclease H-like domain-containing protein n=1 Tax=Tanacetum cinerariifolium TaxID=118510 RepID=A0A6L2JQW4_TANCI|nr:putative ribonuclease H-like domain-containing protein [Tanacetum cinerariifolium]
MTGNRSYLTDYEEIDGGFIAFGGNSKGGKITRKGRIRTGKLDFKDVYFVNEVKFNLLSVSQMCVKKNSILFTDTACVVLSPDFKLTNESHVLLKVPRKDNMYSVDLRNVVPQGRVHIFHKLATIPRRSRKQTTNVVEPEFYTIVEMADNRTMAQMLQAPIEGYEDAIVVPPINANNFELKQTLINLVQSNQFMGRQDPHNLLRFFNKVTSTFRHPEVPNTTIKLLLFPFSLEGEARIWLDKEPPRSILTWEDLV